MKDCGGEESFPDLLESLGWFSVQHAHKKVFLALTFFSKKLFVYINHLIKFDKLI